MEINWTLVPGGQGRRAARAVAAPARQWGSRFWARTRKAVRCAKLGEPLVLDGRQHPSVMLWR